MREAVRKPNTSLPAKRSFSSLGAGHKNLRQAGLVEDNNSQGRAQHSSACGEPCSMLSSKTPPHPPHLRPPLAPSPTTYAPANSAAPACAPLESLLLVERGCHELWHPD